MSTDNKGFKLQLTEAEREVFSELFYGSDAHKVIYKVLEQLTAVQEQALLTRVVDASDQSKNAIVCDKLELQGMNKLVRNFKSLKKELNKG